MPREHYFIDSINQIPAWNPNVDSNNSVAPSNVDDEEQLDNETKRRKRELTSGYYQDSIQPTPQVVVEQGKYSAAYSPLEKVSKKADTSSTATKYQVKDSEDKIEKVEAPAQVSEGNVGSSTDKVDDAKLSNDALANQIERLYAQYAEEHSKGEKADIDKLCEIALRMFALWQRLNSRHDQELQNEHTANLHTHVKKVQDTYNGIGSMIFTIASSVISILGGAGQILGGSVQAAQGAVRGLRHISLARAKDILKISQGASSVGQGVGIPGKLFDESSQSHRTHESHRFEEKKRHRDNHSQNAQRATQSGDANLSSLKDYHRQLNQAKKSAMGADGG